MAGIETNLAVTVELHESPTDTVPADDNPKDADVPDDEKELVLQQQPSGGSIGHVPAESSNLDDIKFRAPTNETESMRDVRLRSINQRNALRVVVNDIFGDDKSDANKSNSKLTNKESSLSSGLVARVTTILIDETDEDTQEYDTTIIALPKSPM